jgi:hypothetical protein
VREAVRDPVDDREGTAMSATNRPFTSSCLLALCAALALSSCTFSSTANQWHKRIGPNGKPI